MAFDSGASLLATGRVPADLRAAVFRAMTRLDGVTIRPDRVTLDGSTGIAVSSAVDDSGVVHEVILDPDTDAYLGSRDVVVEAGSEDIFPPGTVRSQTAVTTDVVQDAP